MQTMIVVTGATTYKYHNRGRVIEEKRIIDGAEYKTAFSYDGLEVHYGYALSHVRVCH